MKNLNAKKVRLTIEEFRKLDAEIPGQTMTIFFHIAENNGRFNVLALSELVGMAHSSVSRNVQYLGKINRHRKPGLDLVRAEEDPMDRRSKVIKLTPKGVRVMEAIDRIWES